MKQTITRLTFEEYKPLSTVTRLVDTDDDSVIYFDTNMDFCHVRESSSDGSGDTLISVHDGSAAFLRDDGVLMTTPPCDEMLDRVYAMAAAAPDDEAEIRAWRLIQSLMMRLLLMQKLGGGNISLVVMQ